MTTAITTPTDATDAAGTVLSVRDLRIRANDGTEIYT